MSLILGLKRNRGDNGSGTPGGGPAREAPAVYTIRPSRGWAAIGFRELWQHRELIYFLAWRDVKVRYKQTVLGATWGDHSASRHHGRLHPHLRAASQNTVGRRTLPHIQLRGTGAVDTLRAVAWAVHPTAW